MTTHFIKAENKSFPNAFSNQKESFRNPWTIWHVGAGIGLLGGLMLLFGGCFLIVFEYFTGEKQLGIWLFPAILPLWIIGAHCFDKVEETEKSRESNAAVKAE